MARLTIFPKTHYVTPRSQLLAAIDGWNAAGADVKAQVGVRPIGVLIGLQATANPFMFCPSYRQLRSLTHDERLARLRDPELRRTLLAEHAASSPSGFVGILHSGYDRMYPLSDPPDYEPTPADSVAGRAAAVGAEPEPVEDDPRDRPPIARPAVLGQTGRQVGVVVLHGHQGWRWEIRD